MPFIYKLINHLPNPYGGKKGWVKNQNNLSEPIWQVGPILPSALVDIVDREREQEVLIELDDFDDCSEKEDADCDLSMG